MRGSDPDAAVYWLAVMIEGGEDPKFIARRMIVFASEDVGNADPRALEVAMATARAVEFVGLPECRINLSQGVAYLASAPKSNAAYMAIGRAQADVRRARPAAAAGAAARRVLSGREEARPRRGLPLPATPTRKAPRASSTCPTSCATASTSIMTHRCDTLRHTHERHSDPPTQTEQQPQVPR